MDTQTSIAGMEFLDLSDATDDERRDAMAIIDSCTASVELPFGCKTVTSQLNRSATPESGQSHHRTDVSDCTSPLSLSRETPPQSLQIGMMHHQQPEQHIQHHWDMNELAVSSGGAPVVCAQPFIYQSAPHYFGNAQIPAFFPPPVSVPNGASGINTATNKEQIKMQRTGNIINGKRIKNEAPFYAPQFPEMPPLDTRQSPSSALPNIDVMSNIPNSGPPPIQPSNYSPVAFGFHPPGQIPFTLPPGAHPFQHPVYLIASAPGAPPYFQYLGMPQPTQMPRISSPPLVPENDDDTKDVVYDDVTFDREKEHDNENDNSSSGIEYDQSEHNLNNGSGGSGSVEELTKVKAEDHVNESILINDFVNEHNNDQHSNETVDLSHDVTNAKSETIENNNADTSVSTYTLSPSSAPNASNSLSSVSSSPLYTTATNVSTPIASSSELIINNNGNSSRSWADLFKRDTLNSASLISPLSSSSAIISSDIVEGYQNTSNDLTALYDTIVDNNSDSKGEAQVLCIPMSQDPFAPILASKLRKITLKHSIPYLIPCGFVNRGNWCYINATLQALLACPPFYNLMREIGETQGFLREGSSTPIIDSFAKFFTYADTIKKPKTVLSADDLQKGDTIEPKCIYDVLGNIKLECLKGRQEDAEEFLSSVLNGLHDEMIALLKLSEGTFKNPLNGNGNLLTANGHIGRDENDDAFLDYGNDNDDNNGQENLWKEVGSRHKALPTRTAKFDSTPISSIFGGSIISVRTAGKDVVGNRQSFFALQLDIQSDKVKSVDDALKCLNTAELIHGYTCPKTKQVMDASNQIFMDTLPPVLIIHLKLFVYDMDGGSRKLMKKIEYPEHLDIPRECLHKPDNNFRKYKLLGVVYHDGNEAVKGHYVTDIYHIGSSHWLRCDDSSIKVININKVLHNDLPRTPYLLFYRRSDTLKYLPIANSTHLKGQKTYSH